MILRTSKLRDAIAIAIVASASTLLGTSIASAQEAEAQEQDAKTLDSVVVTGSRIRQTDTETAQPVLTITRQEIEKQGFQSVGAMLQNISAAGAPPVSRSVLSGNETIGGTYISLRNIGAARTLVLLNGKRLGISNQGLADLSTIPVAAVERIEVLKDGASSIYGSDAIAGVINIITRTNFDGFTVSAYYGQYSQGDGAVTNGSFVKGFTGEKGSITMAAEWAKEDNVAAVDRPFSAFPRSDIHPTDSWHTTAEEGGFVTSALNPVPGIPNGVRVVLREGGNPGVISDYVRQNTFIGSCVGATQATGCTPGSTQDKVNTNDLLDLVMPMERKSFYVDGVYDLTNNIRVRSNFLYSNRFSSSMTSGYPMQASSWNSPLSANSYFNPSANDMATWWRRTSEVPRFTGRDLTTNRFGASIEGSFNWGDRLMDWDVSYLNNENKSLVTSTGNLNLANTRMAVGPSFLNAQGQVQCGTAANPIPFSTCVPFNPLLGFGQEGQGGLTGNQALQDYLFQESHGLGKTQSTVITANLSGSLYALPAGDLGFAVGYENRKEEGRFTPDAMVVAGATTENAGKPTGGGYSVDELYAELQVPLLADMRGAKELTLSLASRFSDYSTFGQTTNNKIGFKWRPFDSLLLRGTLADGFRAPTVFDLYGGDSLGYVFFSDPCDTVFGSSSTNASTRANCAASMGPLANTFRQLSLTMAPVTTASAQTPNPFTLGGNSYLQPEISKTKTIGAVWSPSFAQGLNVTLDWWNVRVDQAITTDFATGILEDCYVLGIASRCTSFTRDPVNGIINYLRYGGINAGYREVEGYDLDISYRFTTENWGDFSLNSSSTYTAKDYSVTTNGPRLPLSQVSLSSVNSTTFRVRSSLNLGWQMGAFGINWTARYFSGLKENCAYFIPGSTEPNLECDEIRYAPTGALTGVTSALQRRRTVGSNTFNDVQLHYETPWNATVALGANNVFNRVGPVMYTNPSSSFLYYGGFDVGRFLYMKYTQKF